MLLLTFFSALFLGVGLTRANNLVDHDDRIQTELVLSTGSTGASTTPDGRVFLILPRVDGTTGAKIVEVLGKGDNNTLVPYPNNKWNSWNASTDAAVDAASKYVATNAQRIGPDGNLWVVDSGIPGQYSNSSKLISFNLTTNDVERVYYLGGVTTPDGLLNDVRFNGKYAYLTEYTIGSIIVLNLETGNARMVLKEHVSTVAHIPDSGDGQFLISAKTGQPQYVHADHLEVSPDGKYLFYQPGSGYMWRIETKYLNDALQSDTVAAELAQYTQPFSLTPATGGTAIDQNGNIYYSDVDRHEIRYVASNGTTALLTRDSRLEWVDAMWIDNKDHLWMSASQLNRGDVFVQPNNQSNTIKKPLYVYTIDIGAGPSLIDHA